MVITCKKKDEHDCNATLYTFRLENLTNCKYIIFTTESLRIFIRVIREIRVQKHRFAKKAAHGQIWFFSPKGGVFATMKAVFWNKTVLGFRPVQELALRHKDGRTGCGAKGHSLHEWCFYCFCFHHINF